MRVLVLLGGDSPEREVSLRSGAAVYDAVKAAGYEVSMYDPIDGYEGLKKAALANDLVLPILHGLNGEDGEIQSKLEGLGVKYLGSGVEPSKNTFYKDISHQILERKGVKMARYTKVSNRDLEHELFNGPYVLKPINGGSSVDTLIVRELTQKNAQASAELLNKFPEMILEQLIDGVEITVPILGSQALPVIAIIPPVGGEFDYDNKYNGATQEICPVPFDLVSKEVQGEAQKLALKVHMALEARHLSRTDMIVTPGGELVVLELNTMPGMTTQSLYPRSAAVAGLDMPALVDALIKTSL